MSYVAVSPRLRIATPELSPSPRFDDMTLGHSYKTFLFDRYQPCIYMTPFCFRKAGKPAGEINVGFTPKFAPKTSVTPVTVPPNGGLCSTVMQFPPTYHLSV